MPSTIQITLTGLLAIFVKPNNEECAVGFLRQTPPHHEFKITITKGGVPFRVIEKKDIKAKLTLEGNKTGISRRKQTAIIDRATGSTPDDEDSFLWVVDFERDFHKKKVGAKKPAFISMLTLNNGELFSGELSENQLLTRIGNQGQFENFGFVACDAGIEIKLDEPNDTTVFKNGDEVIFSADSQTSYEMIFDRGPMAAHPSTHRNHADFYYTALGHLIPPGERRSFSSTVQRIAVTPDAACFTSTGGDSTWPEDE